MTTHKKESTPISTILFIEEELTEQQLCAHHYEASSVAVMKTNLPRTRLHKHMEKSEREEDTRGQVVGVYSGFAWKHKAWPVSLRISIPFVFAYFSLSQNSTFRGEIKIYWQCRYAFPLFLFISRNRYELFTSWLGTPMGQATSLQSADPIPSQIVHWRIATPTAPAILLDNIRTCSCPIALTVPPFCQEYEISVILWNDEKGGQTCAWQQSYEDKPSHHSVSSAVSPKNGRQKRS